MSPRDLIDHMAWLEREQRHIRVGSDLLRQAERWKWVAPVRGIMNEPGWVRVQLTPTGRAALASH